MHFMPPLHPLHWDQSQPYSASQDEGKTAISCTTYTLPPLLMVGNCIRGHNWEQILLSLQWASAINSHLKVFPWGMPVADTEGSPKLPPWRTLAPPSDGGIAHCHHPHVKICHCQSQVSLPSPLHSFSWKVSLITCTGRFRAEPALQLPETRPCPCPCVWVKQAPKVASEEQDVLFCLRHQCNHPPTIPSSR